MGGSELHIMYADDSWTQCKCPISSWKPRVQFSGGNSIVYKDLGVTYGEKIVEAVKMSKIQKKRKQVADLEDPLRGIEGVIRRVAGKSK